MSTMASQALENVDDWHTHNPLVSARFSHDFEEDDVRQVQADCSVPAFAENLDEKRIVVGTIGATGF